MADLSATVRDALAMRRRVWRIVGPDGCPERWSPRVALAAARHGIYAPHFWPQEIGLAAYIPDAPLPLPRSGSES